MALVSADIGSVLVGVAKRFSADAFFFRSPFLLQFSRSRRLSAAAGVRVFRVTSKATSSRYPLHGMTSSRAFSRRFATSASTAVEGSDTLTKIPPDDRIPATIITGFLGSGKTTLLNHILTADHGKRIAVIENEFGEIDIDGSLVAAKTTGAEDIIMLNNGCLCCTVRGDLVRMISELVEKKKGKFDHIVIETTGLANPSPIIQTFYAEDKIFNDVKLDGVVTLVDSKHVGIHLDEKKSDGVVNEAVEQIAYADRIIVNKTDLVTEPEISSLVKRIRSINTMAHLKRTSYGKVDMDYVLGIGGFDLESCFSGSHLSKLQKNFVPVEELLNIIKSAFYEPGGRPLAACVKGNKTLVNTLTDCEINKFSLLLKENMSEKFNGDRNQDAAIEEPYGASSFRNLLLYHAGALSVDEDGGRIFLSDSNHHRIIITDHDGRILDSIGSSPGFLDADFESAKLWRPAASFYNVSDGCLYFVDSENNAIRRADMTRRLVETMYPIPKSSGIWDRISGMWSWILNYSGLAKEKTKSEEFGFDLIAHPWHLLNIDDDELIIISHSFAVAWTMSMTTWKLKEVIRGFHNIFESYGNLIVEKLSYLKDAYVVLPQKFSTSVSSEKIPYTDWMSSVRNFHDDIITYDAVGQSLLKYNKKSMGISHIHFSNVSLLGVPYWISCPIERVFNNRYYRQSNEHVHNFSVLPGRCDVRVNVEIPKDAVLAAPLDENCIWRQARGSAAEVSVLEEGDAVEEKVGVAQQWFDELDNLAFTNPEFESLEFSGEVYGKSIDRSFPDTGKVHFNCAVNVSPGTSEIVVSAALYLKPNPALSFKEAASLLNPQNHENGMLERESFNLFLEKCENISDLIFTKPLHLRIKLDCGDHPVAPTSKETILTDTRLEVNLTSE